MIAAPTMSLVIPGQREALVPESTTIAAAYGFRVRADARPGMTPMR